MAASSVVGDLHMANGDMAMDKGSVADAAVAYTDAVNQYRAEDMLAPAALLCRLGHALTAARTDPASAELAAQSIHQCLLGVPGGSSLRRRALADAVQLIEIGLDPLLLARDMPVRKYITKDPKRAPSETVRVRVVSDVRTQERSHKGFLAVLESPEMRAKLLPCWENQWKASKSEAVSVKMKARYRFREGAYESEDRHRLVCSRVASSSADERDPSSVRAKNCVGNIVADEASRYRGPAGRWDGTLTIALAR